MKLSFLTLKLLLLALLVSGCSTTPPKKTENVCSIFSEYPDWYQYARSSERKWGVSLGTIMAFIHQESRFVEDARPPRPYILGIIPWFRPSSAYGYAQAQDPVWKEYIRERGGSGSSRDDMEYAADFVGWYIHKSHLRLKLPKHDAANHYLAYHEGQGGFSRKTYRDKPWLMVVSQKVEKRAQRYDQQILSCAKQFECRGFWGWLTCG
jgi:hypothetical protein